MGSLASADGTLIVLDRGCRRRSGRDGSPRDLWCAGEMPPW